MGDDNREGELGLDGGLHVGYKVEYHCLSDDTNSLKGGNQINQNKLIICGEQKKAFRLVGRP